MRTTGGRCDLGFLGFGVWGLGFAVSLLSGLRGFSAPGFAGFQGFRAYTMASRAFRALGFRVVGQRCKRARSREKASKKLSPKT